MSLPVKNNNLQHIFQYLQAHTSIGIPLEFQPFTENSFKVPTKHIISIEDITINKELGMGQFGVVQQGTWSTGNQRVRILDSLVESSLDYSSQPL